MQTTKPGTTIRTPPPTPRPEPAAVRLKVQIDRARHNRLTARLIPPTPPD